jgi:cleavage stimulation factor subunit 3
MKLNLCKRYLAWEVSNPLHYEDRNMLKNRVMYAYKSILLMLKFFPEIWCDATNFLFQNEFNDEGISFLQKGLAENPTRYPILI